MNRKVCSKCKKEKPHLDFYKDKSRKDGCRPQCKECTKNYTRLPKSKKLRAAASARYKSKNLDKVRNSNAARHRGMSGPQRDEFILSRGNCCEICGISREVSKEVFNRDLAIDHCHKTNENVGVLCILCNNAAGKIKDDFNLAYRLYKYLERTRKEVYCE